MDRVASSLDDRNALTNDTSGTQKRRMTSELTSIAAWWPYSEKFRRSSTQARPRMMLTPHSYWRNDTYSQWYDGQEGSSSHGAKMSDAQAAWRALLGRECASLCRVSQSSQYFEQPVFSSSDDIGYARDSLWHGPPQTHVLLDARTANSVISNRKAPLSSAKPSGRNRLVVYIAYRDTSQKHAPLDNVTRVHASSNLRIVFTQTI